MGATYTRQSSYSDGDVIQASDTNNEFDQLLAAFAASSGHTHDGTTGEGGPITKLLGTSLTLGDGTAGTDITVTFDGESNDGVLKWMEDEDYFEFSDDILVASTEKLQFRDTAIYINSSADGQLDLVADTEIQIAATTVDINGNVDISGTLTIGSAGISEAELEILDGATVTTAELNLLDGVTSTTTELNIIDGDSSIGTTTVSDGHGIVMNHGGTMAQTTVQTLAAYLDDEITAMPNLVTTAATTVGALNSGSIASGFGAIDNGSSAITTTGTITYGNLSDGTITITAFVDEDDMSSNSATLVPTQQSVKAYVDTQLTAEDLDFQADSGGALSIDLDSETLTFTGGTGIDTSGSGNAVTFAIDSTVTTLSGTQTLTNKTLTSPKINEDVALTSTATELNLLDGVSGLVQADFTKLAAVDATATELNIMDGGTSASSTTLVDADRVVTNDDGTMKQVALTDVKTYLSSAGFTTDDPTALAIALG